jgi:chromosome partitioning protein
VVADVLVVPAQPDELDLWTLPTMAAVYSQAKKHNEALRAVIVLNRVPFQNAAKVPGDVRDWISANVAALAEARLIPLIGRAAYGRATGDGLGVAEPQPHDQKAAAEVALLYKEICKNDPIPAVQRRRAGARGRS